jgi:hypothetical protein
VEMLFHSRDGRDPWAVRSRVISSRIDLTYVDLHTRHTRTFIYTSTQGMEGTPHTRTFTYTSTQGMEGTPRSRLCLLFFFCSYFMPCCLYRLLTPTHTCTHTLTRTHTY